MNTKRRIAALSLGLASLLGGSGLLAADPDRLSPEQLGARMAEEGWTEISRGVFERQRGAGRVERLGFGREGFAATIAELTRTIARLEQEQERYPSDRLAAILADLRAHRAKAEAGLAQLDGAPGAGLDSVAAA